MLFLVFSRCEFCLNSHIGMVGANGILCIGEKFLNNCWKKSKNKEKPFAVGGPMSFAAITHSVYGQGGESLLSSHLLYESSL